MGDTHRSTEAFEEWKTKLWESRRIVYSGASIRAVAMPLGGIGTGQIALCGDGSLRQWQIFNDVNHQAQIPHSFFAIRAQKGAEVAVGRVLQTDALYDEDFEPVPSVTDGEVPDACRQLLEKLPGVTGTEFIGEYPIARIEYLDDDLPVEVSLEAYSPMVPLDVKNSSLPVIVFAFSVHNPTGQPVEISLLGTLQNAVGYDGLGQVTGTGCPCYGGNYNTPLQPPGLTAVHMKNGWLPEDNSRNGSMTLALMGEGAFQSSWNSVSRLWAEFMEMGSVTDTVQKGLTSAGQTRNGALVRSCTIGPREQTKIVFLYTWYFPNRYVNWGQEQFGITDTKSYFWLGNNYANWFDNSLGVARYVQEHFDELSKQTHRFRDTFYDSSLPYWYLDCISSQMSTVRSPSLFCTDEGILHGFEGSCGASTGCDAHGCCPLNCTHVFNYEMTLSKLYPSLERTMRKTDLIHQQRGDGGIIFRTVVPLYLPRWPEEDPVGRPNVACDGHWGTILKTYREYRQSGEESFLRELWPAVKRALEFGFQTWDEDADGMLSGQQWNTYDLNFWGHNTYTTGLYLAALRAAEKMAQVMDDDDLADECRRRCERGYEVVDEALFNGEYYEQDVDEEAHPEKQYGKGCLSDQLFGQWWAHALDLGYILPPEHVKAALTSVLEYNFRTDFVDFKQQPRIFASDDDMGLLTTTWPLGGRPEVPMRYCDEVWTGAEYQVAGAMMYEGMVDEAFQIVKAARERYDGTERSPYNEIECGDHYVRPMSSWILLEAAAGYRYDAGEGFLAFDPIVEPEDFSAFFITAGGWGSFSQKLEKGRQIVRLKVKWGEVKLSRLQLALLDGIEDSPIEVSCRAESDFSDGTVTLSFPDGLTLGAGEKLSVEIG
ncbi:MAG: GH116 family glycosyl-hydrolase [Armatimonadota bacterium]